MNPDVSNVYERYSIETVNTPPRRKLPHPFNPTVKKVGLAKIIVAEALRYNFNLRKWTYRAALLSRPCIYGTFSGRFGGFHPIKEKCTGCMRCVQEYPSVCSVERNPEFYAFADSYWASDSKATASGSPLATVYYEAETGKIPIRGMGYKGPFTGPGWDSIWTDMSEIVRPTRDGVYGREFISTSVDVGRKSKFLKFNTAHQTSSRTVEVPLPILFDYLPPNLNSTSILQSIAGAAKRAGTLFIASQTQASELAAPQQTQLVPLVSPESRSTEDLSSSRLVELESSEPWRVDQNMREQLGIDPGAVLCARLPLTRDSSSSAVRLVNSGVDAIHLTANYHGGAYDGEKDTFVKDLLREVHTKLVSERCRDEVTLIASGGITRAEHVPKAIICGADLVAIDTTVLVALQSQFEGECATAESGRITSEEFDPNWGEQRLVNLLASWHDQLIEILSAMGIRDVRRLRGDVGRAMFNEELEKEAFKDIARGN